MSTTVGKGTTPIGFKATQFLQVVTAADAVGTLVIPKQGVVQAVAGVATYNYGSYTTDGELVVTLTQGTVQVLVTDTNPAGGGGGGTVTNGGGALTNNSLVLGAGSADTKVSAALRTDGAGKLTAGLAGTTAGSLRLENATSGTIDIVPPTGALGTRTLTAPAVTDTLAGIAATQTLTNKTIDGGSNTVQNLGLATLSATGTPDGTKFLRGDNTWAVPGTSTFSQTLLNAVVAAGAGSSFSYPGGSSTLTVTGSNFNGAIVTFQWDIGAGFVAVPGDKSSFSAADGCFVNGIPAGTSVRCLVTGTPGAAITAVLAR